MKKWFDDPLNVLLIVALILFTIILTATFYNHDKPEIVSKNYPVSDTIYIEQRVDLSRLDSISEILYYEVIENQLYLYTKKDSIKDEIDRWNYIRSLDPEGWEQ